eukprot:tig00001021_g6308.t1
MAFTTTALAAPAASRVPICTTSASSRTPASSSRPPRPARSAFLGTVLSFSSTPSSARAVAVNVHRRPRFVAPECKVKASADVRDPEELKLQQLLSKSQKMLEDAPVKMGDADFKKQAVEMYGKVVKASEDWTARGRPAAVLMCEKQVASWAHELTDYEGEAAALTRQAVLSQQLGDLEGALRCYEHALHVQVDHTPGDVTAISQSFFNLGTVCDYLGQDSRALNWYKQCKEMRERTLGLEHPAIVAVDINLGHFYARRNRVAEAGRHWQDALATLMRIKAPTDPEIAITRFNLAPIYETSGDSDMALKMCEGALAVWGADLNADWPSYVACLTRMGEIESRRGKHKEAAGHFQAALSEVRKRIPDEADEDRLAMTFLAARALKEAGEGGAALKLFEEALRGAEGARLGGGSGNPLFEIIVNGVAAARREAGDEKGAAEVESKYPH